MMKRILAVLLVLVALLACTAIASGETEANYTDNVPPVIGDIKFDKDFAIVYEKDGAVIPDTVTITAAVSDDTDDPAKLRATCLVHGYNSNGSLIAASARFQMNYDPETGLFKGNYTFKNTGSGKYVFIVYAYDTSTNETNKEAPTYVTLRNLLDEQTATPVIKDASASFAYLDPDRMNATFTVNAVKLLNGEEKTDMDVAYCLFVILDKDGNVLRKTRLESSDFTEGVGKKTVALNSHIQPGTYTLLAHLCLMEGGELSPRRAEFTAPVTIPTTATASPIQVTDLSFEQDGQLLTHHRVITLKGNVLCTGESSEFTVTAVFVNTSNNKTINLNFRRISPTVCEANCTLTAENAYDGVYKFAGIVAQKDDGTDKHIQMPIQYSPAASFSFTYKENIVKARQITLPDLDLYDHEDIRTVELELYTNPTYQINWKVLPEVEGGTLDIPGVSFWSADESCVTVDEKGLVKAISAGTAYVTISSNDGAVERQIKFKVLRDVTVTHIYLDTDSLELTLNVNPTATISYAVTPENAPRQQLVWSSADPEVATVDQNGVVTAVAAGNTYLTLTDTYTGQSECCNVTVKNLLTQKIVLGTNYVELDLNSKPTFTLSYQTTPEKVTTPGVVWSSSNPAVATVDQNGVISAVSAGTAYVYVVPVDSENAMIIRSCEVKVKESLTNRINMSKTELTMEYDAEADVPSTFSLFYTTVPQDVYTPGVVWASSDTAVATVDQNGFVTATGEGTAVISATAIDGTGVWGECKVTVKATVATTISFAHKTIVLHLNKAGKKTRRLTPNVTPESASYKLRWSSSNPKVASVKNGLVTAKKVGVCYVTATIKGTQYQASVRIKVVR